MVTCMTKLIVMSNTCLTSSTDSFLAERVKPTVNIDSIQLLKRVASKGVIVRILNEIDLVVPVGTLRNFYTECLHFSSDKRLLSRSKHVYDIVAEHSVALSDTVIFDKDVSYPDTLLDYNFKKVKDSYFFWGDEVDFIEDRLGVSIWT